MFSFNSPLVKKNWKDQSVLILRLKNSPMVKTVLKLMISLKKGNAIHHLTNNYMFSHSALCQCTLWKTIEEMSLRISQPWIEPRAYISTRLYRSNGPIVHCIEPRTYIAAGLYRSHGPIVHYIKPPTYIAAGLYCSHRRPCKILCTYDCHLGSIL